MASSLYLRCLLLAVAIIAGFAAALTASVVHDIGTRTLALLSGYSIYLPLIALVGVVLLFLLVRYAEVAVALFLLAGLFKADERLVASPLDLTLVMAGIIVISIASRFLFTNQTLAPPKELLFYLPIVVLMLLSLLYTPDFDAGLEKTLRFVCLTCLGVVSPFVLMQSAAKIERLLITMVACATVMALNSFTMLGGVRRLVAPSGDTGGLGLATAFALAVIWALFFPRMSFFQRTMIYPIVVVLVVALVGSGERRFNVTVGLLVVVSILLYRKLIVDLMVLLAAGVVALPFVRIPAASYEYLSSLVHPPQAFETRGQLMALGIRLFVQHPILGVGIQGYRYRAPNPVTYNFPHNIILELGSELGMIAVVSFFGLAMCSFRTIIRLLRESGPEYRPLSSTVFSLLIFVCLDAAVGGDINNRRLMWFVLGMPFVLRGLQSRKTEARVENQAR